MPDRAPDTTNPFRYLRWRWTHRHCEKTASGQHRWLVVHQAGYDRECVACGLQD